MGWRTVYISGRAKLDLKMNHLIVRKEDIVKIHISEICTLIIESTTVSLTTALLAELSRSKVKVIFCDEKHNPFGEVTSYYNKHNTSLMVKKQVEWGRKNKTDVWTEIIKEKISMQAYVLEYFDKSEAEMLRGYICEIQPGDASNREGHAAKVYFNSLFGMDFIRGRETPVNAALNYGYALLLSSFNQQIVCNGYLTQLGIAHDNQFNQYNLSSDLMEPFRPFVDHIVVELSPDKFEKEEKLSMLQLLEREYQIDEKQCTFQNAISIYSRSVFEAIEQGDVNLIKLCAYEL